ncbi:MAG: hypothetical protein ACT4PW_00540 [Acidimicrobiia bacterium]
MVSGVAALIGPVDGLGAGTNPLGEIKSQVMANGQVALRAFPFVVQDRDLMGYSGHVWLRPGVSLADAAAGVGRRLRDTSGPGEVALVLGAGNVNSIPPLDALAKLYGDNAVALVKLNPVNEYLKPVLNRALAPFVERDLVRVTTGGSDVGSHLVGHAGVDWAPISGSRASHDAIVFAPGEEAPAASGHASRWSPSRSPASWEASGRCSPCPVCRRGPSPAVTSTTWGSGVGVMHNALLLDPDQVERRVGRGPSRPWPEPVWSVGNRTASVTGERMTGFAAEPSLLGSLPKGAAAAASSLRG